MIGIKLARLKGTNKEQMVKIGEEYDEVLEAYFSEDTEELKKELFDLMQSAMTMLLGISSNVEYDNLKHLEKMEEYLRIGRVRK